MFQNQLLKNYTQKQKKELQNYIKQHQEKTKDLAKEKKIELRSKRYLREYHHIRTKLRYSKSISKKEGTIFVSAEPKVAFIFRIRGIIGVPPKPKKILQLLRLRQIHNGTFIRLNGASINMLRLVEPYISYGYPSLKTISKLIMKRGYCKVKHQRIPINNLSVSHHLGIFGIHSVDDLIHEIYTCGRHFKQANNFLWPFKLNSPIGGFKGKLIHFCEGGSAGNSGRFINQLLNKMIN